MNAIMPRATIEDIVRYRNEAAALYEIAYGKIEEAATTIGLASERARMAYPGINSYNHSQAKEIATFHDAVCLPERQQYLRTVRRLIDLNSWAWIVQRTDLERLMDSQAKEQLRAQMRYIPDRVDRDGQLVNEDEIAIGMPPLTVENIVATLEQFAMDADTIFRRGIANAFSKLDRRFRSHDGFKIGSRIILTYVFNDWGSLNYGSVRDTLIDIERVFAVLDGHCEASFTSALYALDADRRGSHGRRQSEIETEYFKIRGFMNGNAHLWFQRQDLVAKVNKLLPNITARSSATANRPRKTRSPMSNTFRRSAMAFIRRRIGPATGYFEISRCCSVPTRRACAFLNRVQAPAILPAAVCDQLKNWTIGPEAASIIKTNIVSITWWIASKSSRSSPPICKPKVSTTACSRRIS